MDSPGALATLTDPRYDPSSAGFPIGSGPRIVARCDRRCQLLACRIRAIVFIQPSVIFRSRSRGTHAETFGLVAVNIRMRNQALAEYPAHHPFAATDLPGYNWHGP